MFRNRFWDVNMHRKRITNPTILDRGTTINIMLDTSIGRRYEGYGDC